MQIPDKFISKVHKDFGQAGIEWIKDLPGYLSECEVKWQLTNLYLVENLSINLICYAQSSIYGDVVLKLQGPHAERKTEVAALQMFAVRQVCKLHAVDEKMAALLLERIMPGGNLKSYPDKHEQLEIGAELVAKLPIQVNLTHGLPTYQTWISNALNKILPRFSSDPRLIKLINTADEIFNDISPPGSPQYLLHGDLHHENILQSHHQGWKIIDPHEVIDLPFMESARFIQNHIMGENQELDFDQLDETISCFAWRLEQPKSLISRALFIVHALSTCWDLEMNSSQDQIETQIFECEYILEFLIRY